MSNLRLPLGKMSGTFAVVTLIASLLVACAQPAPTPTATTAPKPATAKPTASEAKPAAKDATPAASATKPAAKQAEKKLTKFVMAYSAVAGSQAPLWITKEKGLFEKHGIDIDMPYIASGSVATNAMLSGEVNIALGGEGIIAADLAGADLVMLGATQGVFSFTLFGQPDIQRIEDLKGKTIGITRFGATTDVAARMTLKKFGLEPDKDVAIVQMGGTPETMGGMKSGAIQGTVTGPPNSVSLKKLGMRELVDLTELGIPYPSGALPISKKYLAANRETVINVMKAFVEGIAVGKQDKPFALKVLSDYIKTDDKDVLEETYDLFINRIVPKVPYISDASVQAMIDDTAAKDARAKGMKPESFVDNSIFKEIEASGFVNSLYK